MSVLDEAETIVNGPRAAVYGPPKVNLRRIADLWSAYLERTVTAVDVCHLMILLKVARSLGPTNTRDNLVDLVGYARLIEIIETGEPKE